jgi:hypothetical protein
VNKQDLIRLILILLIAGSGFLRWVFVKLQEQAAKKRSQEEIEGRRTEALRTGRDLEETADPSVERARAEAEAARRRQAQIDEFRRRQQERARQRAEAQRASVPFPAQPASTPRPAAPRPSAPKATRQLLVPSAAEPEATHSLVARPEPKAAPTVRAMPSHPRTPEQWRRAIVLSALLSPAPGLNGGTDPWSPVA